MATLTTVVKPSALCPGLKIAVYSLAFDSSYPTGGEAVDISADFTKVYAVLPGGNDTLADNGYSFAGLFTRTATVSSSNVLITVNWEKNPADAGGADIPFPEFTDTGNLSAVGQLTFTVLGK
jgi:hypothetical protein